jgi:hypothetical protein
MKCVSKLQESPALLCESPKSHDPGPGRRYVIRAKNLPKHAIFVVVRPALPQYSINGPVKLAYTSLNSFSDPYTTPTTLITLITIRTVYISTRTTSNYSSTNQ